MEISRTIYSSVNQNFKEYRDIEVTYTPDVVFARRETGDLCLQILSPVPPVFPAGEPFEPEDPDLKRILGWIATNPFGDVPVDPPRLPCIIDVPGSGWAGADGHWHIPKMMRLAEAGYVVACVTYRGTYKDNVRFPAAVQDANEAVRFMRANADIFHVDPDRIGVLGDSSGGHTAIMVSLTDREERFNIGDNLDQSSAVKAAVVFYGPNDLTNLVADRKAEGKKLRPGEDPYPFESWEIYGSSFLKDTGMTPEEKLADASAINYVSADKKLCPTLFICGDDDQIIPLQQGLRYCQKLRDNGARAEFIKIAGGFHGHGCWSNEVMDEIIKFFKAYL